MLRVPASSYLLAVTGSMFVYSIVHLFKYSFIQLFVYLNVQDFFITVKFSFGNMELGTLIHFPGISNTFPYPYPLFPKD
jgi:hypothetical protein